MFKLTRKKAQREDFLLSQEDKEMLQNQNRLKNSSQQILDDQSTNLNRKKAQIKMREKQSQANQLKVEFNQGIPMETQSEIEWPQEFKPLIKQRCLYSSAAPEAQSAEQKNQSMFSSMSSRPFLLQQQMQYNQAGQQLYFPLIDKVKAYILAINLRQILQAKKEVDQEIQESGYLGQMEKNDAMTNQGLFFHVLEKSGQISTIRELMKTEDPEMGIVRLWNRTKSDVKEHLSVFDSDYFSSKIGLDPVSANQLVYKVKNTPNSNHNLIEQFCEGEICSNLIRIVSEWLKLQQQEQGLEAFNTSDHVVYLTFKIKGFIDDFHLLHDEQSKSKYSCKLSSTSIEFTRLIKLLINIRSPQGSFYDEEEKKFKNDADRRRESLSELLTTLGIDVAQMSENYGVTVAYPQITKVLIQFYRVPKIPDAQDQPRLPNILSSKQQFNPNFDNLCCRAIMPLYSISRARIQYLGASIPLFRFRHSLFEALISAIHERDIRPNFFEDYKHTSDFAVLLQEPISHEKFLVKKYLEFMSHPYLKQLLVLSYSGDSLKFVEYFNSLQESMCPSYSQYKLWFYDINQRKFIVEHELGKDIYVVHYNGFVFGANYPKMIVIREREVASSRSADGSGEEEVVQIKEEDITVEELAFKMESQDSDGASESSQSSETEELAQKTIPRGRAAHDGGNDSDIDIHNGFMLTNHHRNVRKRPKKQVRNANNKEQGKQDSNHDVNIGILAIRLTFDKSGGSSVSQQVPVKLICYGSLPNRALQLMKVFEGRNCHLKFILWILQNLLDYKIDKRADLSMVSVFTVGGSNRELPWLMRGFVQLAGRDTHFFGDMNKIKCLWHDNIKFYDLSNFFENQSISQLSSSWLTKSKRDFIKTKSKDPDIQKVFLTFELAQKFLKEINNIRFNSQAMQKGCKEVMHGKKFDFHQYQTATSSLLALSVFQFLYLDPNTEIRGTWDNSIFKMEKQSLRSPYIAINQLKSTKHSNSQAFIDLKKSIYRVYRMNCLQPSIYRESPIPHLYKGYHRLKFSFVASKCKVQTWHKPFQHLKILLTPVDGQSGCQEKLTIMYSSLYKVDYLRFKPKGKGSTLWNCLKQQKMFQGSPNPSGSSCLSNEIRDEYVWGVELISAFLDFNSNDREPCLQALSISEEVIYFQSRIFSKFANDLIEKLNNKGLPLDPCQREILEMILNQFASKFPQRHFGMQSIIHINDLKLMSNKELEARFSRLVEIQYPFYYAEYISQSKIKTGHMQQIGSLARITSFVNACSRVKLMQSLEGLDIDSDVVYFDKKNLIVRDQRISPNWTTSKSEATLASGSGTHQYLRETIHSSYQHQDVGKWSLEYETSLLEADQSMDVADDAPASSANHLFQTHIDMLLSQDAHALLEPATPMTSNCGTAKISIQNEDLSTLLFQDATSRHNQNDDGSNLAERGLAERGLGFLINKSSDAVTASHLKHLYRSNSRPFSQHKVTESDEDDLEDAVSIVQMLQNEPISDQAINVLSKALQNFESTCQKYLNGTMTAEELAQHEQQHNMDLQDGENVVLSSKIWSNKAAKNQETTKSELLCKRPWQTSGRKVTNSEETHGIGEKVALQSTRREIGLGGENIEAAAVVEKVGNLPILKLQLNSRENYSLLLGGGAERIGSDEELQVDDQDSSKALDLDQKEGKGSLISQYFEV